MESIKRLNNALAYVEDTLESQIDEAEFSRIAACPFTVFQRFFMLITGTTLNEYVRLRRFSRAAEEILNSQIKIIDIALKYGYESSDAFCVAFKRIYGIRRQLREKITLYYRHMTVSHLRYQSNILRRMQE